MGDLVEGDWSRLATLLEHEMYRLGHTQAGLEAAMAAKLGGGPKARSIRAAMRKKNPTRHSEIPPTHKRLAAFFGWAPGSIEAVLAGGDPTYLPPPDLAVQAPKTKGQKWEEAQRIMDDPSLTDAQRQAALRVLREWPEAPGT